MPRIYHFKIMDCEGTHCHVICILSGANSNPYWQDSIIGELSIYFMLFNWMLATNANLWTQWSEARVSCTILYCKGWLYMPPEYILVKSHCNKKHDHGYLVATTIMPLICSKDGLSNRINALHNYFCLVLWPHYAFMQLE